MTLSEIKQSLADGNRVHWANVRYEIIYDGKQYLIGWDIGGRGENYIGLTWLDGITLNGKESEFFEGA